MTISLLSINPASSTAYSPRPHPSFIHQTNDWTNDGPRATDACPTKTTGLAEDLREGLVLRVAEGADGLHDQCLASDATERALERAASGAGRSGGHLDDYRRGQGQGLHAV